MPCGVVLHSAARACWRCPKRTQLAVYALIALNAGTRAPKLKIGQNPNKPGGCSGPWNCPSATDSRVLRMVRGRFASQTSGISRQNATTFLRHQNRRNLTSATLQSDLNISFKAATDREPRRLARRDAWALNSTIFLNTHIAAREQPPGPQSSLESVLWTPKTPEQRSRAV